MFEIIQDYYPDIEESSFIDSIQNNLKKGRFLLMIIGDGIRENMEELIEFIHTNGNLNFTLGLVELPVYRNPTNDVIIITPRILAKTKEIERIIYRFSDEEDEVIDSSPQVKTESRTISEKVFYERLQKSIGKEKANQFNDFVSNLTSEFNIIPKLGRGKRLSLNLKSSNDTYNFASVQENGEVWFYGIVNKTEEIGDKQIGIDYLKRVANIVGGDYTDHYSQWNWCVKRNEKYINITEYLSIQKEWKEVISETLDRINEAEENE